MYVTSAVPVFPFSRLVETIQKPLKINYIENPSCVGEEIKNKRLLLGLTQEETAERIGVARNAIIDWENTNTKPTIEFYPGIIEFLEYMPFYIDTSTVGGKVRDYRFRNGLSLEQLAQKIPIGSATIFRLENGKGLPNKKTRKALRKIMDDV
jgi:transcriptional regulator with XRE-family HTH domain